MNNFEPKQGESILVERDNGLWAATPRVFVSMHKGRYLCENAHCDSEFDLWGAAKPLPTKPEPTPFTHETWPKQVVFVAVKENEKTQSWGMLGFHGKGIRTSSRSLDFSVLMEHYEMSLDFCQTWQPCYYNPNPKD